MAMKLAKVVWQQPKVSEKWSICLNLFSFIYEFEFIFCYRNVPGRIFTDFYGCARNATVAHYYGEIGTDSMVQAYDLLPCTIPNVGRWWIVSSR